MAGIGVSLVAMIGVRVFTPLAWTWYVAGRHRASAWLSASW